MWEGSYSTNFFDLKNRVSLHLVNMSKVIVASTNFVKVFFYQFFYFSCCEKDFLIILSNHDC